MQPMGAEEQDLVKGDSPSAPGPSGASGPDAPPVAPAPVAKRKHPRWLIVAEVLTVLIVVAPLLALAIASHVGGGSSSVQVAVRNDGASTLTVQPCAPGCAARLSSVVLTAGSSTELTTGKGGTVYYLLNATGSVAGCLRLTTSDRHEVVTTSQATPCSGKP
jgi:hypothetical protein